MTKYKSYLILLVTVLISMASGCTPSWEDDLMVDGGGYHGKNNGDRTETPERRKVLLLYSAGNNSLSSYLRDDIQDLKQGRIPGRKRSDDVLLVYAHSRLSSSPCLIRLYDNGKGEVQADTLTTYSKGTISSSPEQLQNVLAQVKDAFPARSYGMIFSSHATGYLPAGYYSNPNSYKFAEERTSSLRNAMGMKPVPYIEREHNPAFPMVKSIGQDVYGSSSYEMDLKGFAKAIPMKLDYILFDACLMGGAEVAFELRDKCRRIGFSQAEVLAEGLDYKTLTEHLLFIDEPDPGAVCEDYYRQYEIQTGLYKSATVSMVNTEYMEELADVCARLFAKYRSGMNSLDISSVQNFGGKKTYFFDMADAVRCAGATAEEVKELRKAVDKVVEYRNHTGQYYSATDYRIHKIDQDKFCGLSMYIPSCGSTELAKYYKTLSWNKATGLVE